MSGRSLMTAAATVALADLRGFWPAARSCSVVCGPGNNGGDGYDFARLASAAGFAVSVHSVVSPGTLQGDARLAFEDWIAAGGTVRVWTAAELATPALGDALLATDVVVDALFGIGLSRPLQGVWAHAVAAINRAEGRIHALDIPSGVEADSGQELGLAVRATFTSSFVGWKAGLFLAPGFAGRCRLHSLGIPDDAFAPAAVPLLRRIASSALTFLPRRPRDAHKGRHGHVLVVGGDHGMPGAVRLAAEAALRSGAGRVTVATRTEHARWLPLACPEVMAVACETPADLLPRLAMADAVVCGPGLGRGAWGDSLLRAVLGGIGERPLVLDADALHGLLRVVAPQLPPVLWLTPHPGEAAVLLGTTVAAIQADRLGAVKALASRWRSVVVLKGAATLVAGPATLTPWVCDLGNPGMGTAGMGDVLAGLCAGLAAQQQCDATFHFSGGEEGWVPLATLAVLAHAAAGDAAARIGGERGLIASDLFVPLRRLLNGGTEAVP